MKNKILINRYIGQYLVNKIEIIPIIFKGQFNTGNWLHRLLERTRKMKGG